MSPRKISPIIPLVIGVLCIGIALLGGIIAFTKEDDTGKKSKVAVKASARKPSKAKRRPAAAEKFQPSPVVDSLYCATIQDSAKGFEATPAARSALLRSPSDFRSCGEG